MYVEVEEEKKGFPLRDFLIKLLLIIIFVVLLVLFLPIPKLGGITDKVFNANVQNVKEASLSYFTTERLPKKVGESLNLTLQEMVDLHLILPFTDKDGNACSMENSFVELKKLEKEYEMKVHLKCNDEENYVITKMGCYDYCEGSICEEKKCPECPKCEECPTCAECPKENETPSLPVTPTPPTNPTLPYKPGDTPPPEETEKPPVTPPVKPPVKPDPTPTPPPTNPDPAPDYGNPSCTLQITYGTKGENDWYRSNVTVAFASKSASKNATITGYGIGTSFNYNGNNSYTVTSNGVYTIYGYVKDSNGKTANCKIVVKKDTETPDCKLGILKGTRNAEGIFITDVIVGFVSKIDNVSGIRSFGMGTTSSPSYNGVTSYTISKDGVYTIYGYVKDHAGNSSSCSMTIEKKEQPTISVPSCELEVVSGTLGTGGWYISNINIGFKYKTSTNGATITDYGIGTSLNYNGNNNYIVTNDGVYTIYGYVRDSRGNTGYCSKTVEKRSNISKPSCELEITSGTMGENGWYISDVNVGFKYKSTTNGAIITNHGIGTSTNYNGGNNYWITTDGIHTIYGYVKDSNGNTAYCNITVKKDSTPPKCEITAVGGSYNSAGKYFTSNIVMGWTTKSAVSGISAYGIGLSFNYSMNSTYTITSNGVYNVYGYLKSNSGLTSSCCIKVERRVQ